MSKLTEKMVLDILSMEDSDSRFEKFCIDLFSKLDGVDYITTSASWDLGRDGRQASLFNNEIFPIICVSLDGKVERKAAKDIKRLLVTTDIPTIRFLTTKEISEHGIDTLKLELKNLSANTKQIHVDGLKQIEKIIRRHAVYQAIFERHYPGEVAEQRAALAAVTESSLDAVSGMQVALSTQLSTDGITLRNDLICNLLLNSLASGKSKTRAGLTKNLSDSLYLGRVVYEGYIASALSDLEARRYIQPTGKLFRITDTGSQFLASRAVVRTQTLEEGRIYLRQAVESSTGFTLGDNEFGDIWKIVQEELASLLYLQGIQTINALSAVVDEGTAGISGQVDLSDRINGIGAKVKEALSRTPLLKAKGKRTPRRQDHKQNSDIYAANPASPRAIDIGQAIVDSFHNTKTLVFDWFTKLCVCYTAICSLGLSEESQTALVRKLKKLDLFLDTDIVLSLLAEGEPDHEKIVSLVDGWSRVGGQIHIAIPVLEELAHHASISETDFREVFHDLHRYNQIDAERLITNAFVRGYWALGKRLKTRYSYASWRQYIGNFKGRSETDYQMVAQDLKAEKFFPADDELGDKDLANKISTKIAAEKTSLASSKNPEILKKGFDKSDRDGRLVAHVYAYRRNKEQTQGTAIIVSSSPLLAKVCRDLSLSQGSYSLVLPLGSVAYLLSMVPGLHLSLFGLRSLLFDSKFHEHVSHTARVAFRLLYNSNQFSLPFARRASLEREMDNRIGQVAEQRGERPSQTREFLNKRSDEAVSLMAEIVHDSIDKIAISESEKQIRDLVQENERLKEALARRFDEEKKP